MSLRCTIGGTERKVYANPSGGLKISCKLGKPATGSFEIREALPSTLVTRGQEVIIYDDALTETIRQTIAGIAPPGLRYEAEHEGKLVADLAKRTRYSGTVEGIFSNLYNLPDISEYGVDAYIRGFDLKEYRTPGYSSVIWAGVAYILSARKYYYYASVALSAGDSYILVSTSEVELDVSRRLSIVWSANEAMTETTVQLCVDGSVEDTYTGPGIANYNAWSIGPDKVEMKGVGASLGIGQYFADVRVWKDVRTPAELLANAFTRLTGADLTDPNLEVYWKLDEDTGTVADDAGPADNDGALTDEGYGYLGWATAPDEWLLGGDPTCQERTVTYRYFGGRVEDVEYEISEPNMMVQKIKLIDYSEVAARRIINQNFGTARDGKYYVQWIADHIMGDEGINYACIPTGSPILNVPDWRNTYAKKALDQIATVTEWVWYVDPYKELRYHSRGYKAAPWNIADADSPGKYLSGSLRPTLDKDGYFNKLRARIKVSIAGTETAVALTLSDDVEIAARAAAEGGSGIYEHYEDISDAATIEQGIDMAQGMLSAARVLGKTVRYDTLLSGLRVGMSQNIANSDYGLGGAFLIESIEISFYGHTPIYRVSASSWTMPKDDPLSKTLDAALESKRNWRESAMSERSAYVIAETEAMSMTEAVSVTDGTITDLSKWGTARWGLGEWQ